MMKFKTRLSLSGQSNLIEKVIAFFTAKALNERLYQEIVKSREKYEDAFKKENANFNLCTQMGYFCVYDFLMFEGESALKNGIPMAVVEEVASRMEDAGIINNLPMLPLVRGYKLYGVNEGITRFLAERRCLENAIFDFSFIAGKYSRSVFKVVAQENGDQHIGSGFLTALEHNGKSRHAVVTNKHVAKFQTGLKVLDQGNQPCPHSEINLSEKDDIAAVFLEAPCGAIPFRFFEPGSVLDEIITLGYPNVAMANDSYQLVHRGEINSMINDYHGRKLMLFSAKTAPGNSGGPLVNNLGMVVGMVTQDLFYKDALLEKGQLPYHAAIPASAILDFLQSFSNKHKPSIPQ